MRCEIDGSVMVPTEMSAGVMWSCTFCRDKVLVEDVCAQLQREWGVA